MVNKEKDWDNVQDISKLVLSIALLVVAPEIQMPIKIATIGMGILNRFIKIKGVFSRRTIGETIKEEQKMVFDKSWKRTKQNMNQHSRNAIVKDLELILKNKLGTLSSYDESELEDLINNTVKNPHIFLEWYVQSLDLKEIFDCFLKVYEEEVLSTKVLFNYYSQIKCNTLKWEVKKLSYAVEEISDKIFKIIDNQNNKVYTITDSDIMYYRAWINNYASSVIDLYEDLPINEYNNDSIHELLNRISAATWKQDTESLLRKIMTKTSVELSDKIKQCIERISCNIEYEIIKQLVSDLLDSIELDPELHKEYENEFRQGFDKIAVISGEPGSGKTHFFRDVLLYSQQKEYKFNLILVPLESEELIIRFKQGNIYWEEFLLDRINTCLNIKITDFGQLNDAQAYRIVFMIDDIHRLCLYDQAAYKQFIYSLKKMTKYDLLSWLLTINEFDIYILDNECRILQDYCITFHNNCDLYEKAFSLTTYNEKMNIGEKILLLYGIKISEIVNNEETFRRFSDNTFCTPINNPLYAHVIGKNCSNEYFPYIANYLDFIFEITSYIDQKIKNNSPRTYTLIRETISSISQLSLNTGNVIFHSSLLESTGSHEIITILRDNNLLHRLKEESDIMSPVYLDDLLELYTSIFWVFKMVLFEASKKESCEVVFSRLIRVRNYQNELIPCYLLLLDHDSSIDKCITMFHILREKGHLHYALFASIRASLSYNDKLMEMLINDESSKLSLLEAFALVFYLYNYNAKVLNKYYVLNKFIEAIYQNELIYGMEILLSKMLGQVKSLANFKKNIKPLFEGRNIDMNHWLGYRLGSKYFLLNEKSSTKKQMNDLVRYIIENLYLINVSVDNRGESFFDFFLRAYFTEIIVRTKIGLDDIYDELKDCFFDTEFGLLIRRNFSCAAGNVYEKSIDPRYQQQFISLINKIMDRGGTGDYMFAFHFISNTLDDSEKKVDNMFLPILSKIWNDPRLDRFCKNKDSRMAFFLNNLNDQD